MQNNYSSEILHKSWQAYQNSSSCGQVPLRSEFVRRLQESGIPNRRQEAWKYTNLSFLAKQPFYIPSENKILDYEYVTQFRLSPDHITFLNGIYSSALSSLPQGANVEVSEVSSTNELSSQTLETLNKPFNPRLTEPGFLDTLNGAFFNEGIRIVIGKGVQLEHPIQIIHITTADAFGQPIAVFPSITVNVAEGAKAGIVETHFSPDSAEYPHLNSSHYKFKIEEKAELTHIRCQMENEKAYSLLRCTADVAKNARYDSFVYNAGAKLCRSEIDVRLSDTDARTTLNGVYLTMQDGQHCDNQSSIIHSVPQTYSEQYYKGLLDGKSRAVFNGKVFVDKYARDIDAQQLNKNLLLSDDAEIDTKPELQIDNNDVKCSHGATVGQLDEEQLFYLQTRGLPRKAAANLLTLAFVQELLDPLPFEKVSHFVSSDIKSRLSGDSQLGAGDAE